MRSEAEKKVVQVGNDVNIGEEKEENGSVDVGQFIRGAAATWNLRRLSARRIDIPLTCDHLPGLLVGSGPADRRDFNIS